MVMSYGSIKTCLCNPHSLISAIALGIVVGCASASQATVLTSQSITLNPGWNAVYIEVSPQCTPNEVFASWPVASVGLYDPASFLSTRQFSSDWSS